MIFSDFSLIFSDYNNFGQTHTNIFASYPQRATLFRNKNILTFWVKITNFWASKFSVTDKI